MHSLSSASRPAHTFLALPAGGMKRAVIGRIGLILLACASPAQSLQPGDAPPALSVTKWLAGKPLEALVPGRAHLIGFWGSDLATAAEQAKDFAALQKKHSGKLEIAGVLRDGEDITLEAAEKHFARHGADIGYRIGWDPGGKLHDAWVVAAQKSDEDLPAVFVVDQKGRFVWAGGILFLEVVLPAVLAGTSEPQAIAEQAKAVEKRVLRLFLVAGLRPEKAIAELDALLKDHPFLAGAAVPGVFNSLMQDGHRDLAMQLAPRLCDLGTQHESPEMLNMIAWAIVDPAVETEKRDLATAQRAAAKAVELTKEKDAAILDTFARVWFWQKDLARAVAWQQKAVDLTPAGEERDGLAATLQQYKELAAKK